MRFFRRSGGFTVLEVLIVLAVIGLLATLSVLSLNSARARTRDAQRQSDISVLRSALSQYWLEKATYPSSGGINLGEPGANADALSANGFVSAQETGGTVYIPRIPTGPRAGEYYRYHGGPNGYSLRFRTESDTIYGKANVYYAHASGIDSADEEK
jgi:prepilin-type N-terminal cleavage/methylation domain-containing protein